MAKQIAWNKSILDNFKEEALLSDEEAFIMESRIKGWTVTKQALYLNKSESTVHAMIKNLKEKYDNAQKARPEVLPERLRKDL